MFNKFIELIKGHKGKFFWFYYRVYNSYIGFKHRIFFKTLFIALCTWLGYYLGSRLDNKENFKEMIEKLYLVGKNN